MLRLHKNRRYRYKASALQRVKGYLEEHLGPIERVVPSFANGRLPVDIAVIPPKEGQEYYTLVTLGMGAYRLRTPKGLPNRLELAIRLPGDWELENNRERWFWPVRWLQVLARMPMYQIPGSPTATRWMPIAFFWEKKASTASRCTAPEHAR